MSALAQIAKAKGAQVFGSDRNFDSNSAWDLKEKFEKKGIKIVPQDGTHLDFTFDAAVFSTAVEKENLEYKKAENLKIKIIHRSDFLADYINKFKTVAVSGTSGKSTVTALIYHILERNGLSPSIITGGALNELIDEGEIGNAAAGNSDWLVAEADESDGTLVKYSPYAGVILNISKDHKEISQLMPVFNEFSSKCKTVFLNEDDEYVKELPGNKIFFSLKKIENLKMTFSGSEFTTEGEKFFLPLPGEYNIRNFAAAVCVCRNLAGLSMKNISSSVRDFKGVYRRFNIIGEKNGICVIDDFAHNPAKIEAALSAAKIDLKGRLFAVYQPHGFAPTRLLRKELIETFSKSLRKEDFLFMPDIYYAGGTVAKDISSADIINPLKETGLNAFYMPERKNIPSAIREKIKSGDRIISMGARDLSLRKFASDILEAL